MIHGSVLVTDVGEGIDTFVKEPALTEAALEFVAMLVLAIGVAPVIAVVVRGNCSNGTRRWHPTVGHTDG